MSNENNKMQVDIENLFKQNVNDLSAIKELYRKLKEVEEKIIQIKYIDSTLANKLKKEYEKLKRIIIDENIQVQLNNKIDEINSQLDNRIDETNSQLDDVNIEINSKLDTIKKQVVYTNNPPKGLIPLIGDGTDESEKLSKIIEYCCDNNKKLIINEGTYLVNIEINKRISIEGCGRRKTILKSFTPFKPVIKFIGTPVSEDEHSNKHIEFIELSNMTINGNGHSDGLSLNFISRSTFNNIEIENCIKSNGLYLLECFDSAFYSFSIGESGTKDHDKSGIYIQNGLDNTVDNCNTLKFFDFILQNNLTDIVIDGSITSSPNNNITFYAPHIEYWSGNVDSAIFIKGKNENIVFNGGTIVNYKNKFIEFDVASKGNYKFDKIQQWGNLNTIIYDIKGNNDLFIDITQNEFLSSNPNHIQIADNLKNNILLIGNRGRCDAKGSYKVNDIYINDFNNGFDSTLEENYQNLVGKNKKGEKLLKIFSNGSLQTSDIFTATLENGQSKIFDLGHSLNTNGINYVFITSSYYLDSHVIAYTSGENIYPIHVGDAATCQKTNADENWKLNVFMNASGKIQISSKLAETSTIRLFCISA